jgi:hypothetical protein
VWQLQAAAAAATQRAGTASSSRGSGNAKKLITELETDNAASADGSSSSSHAASTGSSSSSSWVEVGGSLDGVLLDSSASSLAKQLEAAVLDCRAALQLVPKHAKAQYRWGCVWQGCTS